MIKLVIFFIIILICVYFLFGKQLSDKAKKYFVIFFIAVLALFLIFSGKLNFLPVALAPALLFFRRISSLLSIFNFISKSAFGKSFKPKITTKYLSIEIQLQSKQVNIEIINGEFKGRLFSSLSQIEIKRLLEELKVNDPRGYNFLNLIINQSAHSFGEGNTQNSMSEEEAYSILGLEKGASKEDIKKTYYNLMKKFHPDKDGTNYLSNLITQAKNKLLN